MNTALNIWKEGEEKVDNTIYMAPYKARLTYDKRAAIYKRRRALKYIVSRHIEIKGL